MLISCQNCATSYQVDPSSLGPAGRSVRCVRCQRVWFAANSMALAEIAQAHRADLAALSAPSVAPIRSSRAAGAEAPRKSPRIAPDSGPQPERWKARRPGMRRRWTRAARRSRLRPQRRTMKSSPNRNRRSLSSPPRRSRPIEQGETHRPAPAAGRRGHRDRRLAPRQEKAPRRRLRWPLAAWPTVIPGPDRDQRGADRAARRGGEVAAADRLALCGDRAAGQSARPRVRESHHRKGNPRRRAGAGGRGHDRERRVARHEVPRLRFGVRNGAGLEIYSWTALPTRSVLAPGETLAFRSRLASPPRERHDVVVRFFNRRDLVAGIQ